MKLLAESSAVLAWLFNEPAANEVGRLLRDAQQVVTSTLTWIECDRVIQRHASLGQRPAQEIQDSRSRFQRIQAVWVAVEMGPGCQRRARESFPVEPVRTLDAIHLATAVLTGTWVADLAVLSLDQRIRDNARALGFPVLPA